MEPVNLKSLGTPLKHKVFFPTDYSIDTGFFVFGDPKKNLVISYQFMHDDYPQSEYRRRKLSRNQDLRVFLLKYHGDMFEIGSTENLNACQS
jgi:hypothetical protein